MQDNWTAIDRKKLNTQNNALRESPTEPGGCKQRFPIVLRVVRGRVPRHHNCKAPSNTH